MSVGGFESAQHAYDNQEPPDERSEASIDYQERLTTLQQQQICLDFLEAKEMYVEYEDWRIEKDWKGSWIDGCQSFCESDDRFWEWLDD